MIDIIHKEDCCGCSACIQICPKQCISFDEDEQGFRYPKVNLERCINCGLCERVCPVIHQGEKHSPLEAYAAKNRTDSIRRISSSGGIFHALATYILSQGGIVFGAKYNSKWEVEHDYTDNPDKLKNFLVSKYVQSNINRSYRIALDFLKEGKSVLFSGTSCQIAGLRRFINKDFGDKLITVDIICHGVPSPLIFRDFLNSLTESSNSWAAPGLHSIEQLKAISFRDKTYGWENFGFSIEYVNEHSTNPLNDKLLKHFIFNRNNPYISAFFLNYSLRPSCYKCCAKSGKSGSDITLGDFWGIPKEYPELYRKGMYSAVTANTELGLNILNNIEIESSIIDFSKVESHNPAYNCSVRIPRKSVEFWEIFQKGGIIGMNAFLERTKPSRLATLIKRVWRKLSLGILPK